jgi:hypothetical protein
MWMERDNSKILTMGILSWCFFTLFIMLFYPQNMALAIEVSSALFNLLIITVMLMIVKKFMGVEYLLLYSLVPSMGIYLMILRSSGVTVKTLYLVFLLYWLAAGGILWSFRKNRDLEYYRVLMYFLVILPVGALTKNKEFLTLAIMSLFLMVLLFRRSAIYEVVCFNALSMVAGIISVLEINPIPASNLPLSNPRPSLGILLILLQQVIYSTIGVCLFKKGNI